MSKSRILKYTLNKTEYSVLDNLTPILHTWYLPITQKTVDYNGSPAKIYLLLIIIILSRWPCSSYISNSRYIGYTQKLALLLDYDGTLAPIAPHPDLATLPLETKHTLQRLSNMSDVYIAIISGRNVDNVKKMVSFLTFSNVQKLYRPAILLLGTLQPTFLMLTFYKSSFCKCLTY